MKKNFAIIDIETTGGSAKLERIIEIAIVIYDGKKIIDSFESLINPERTIPPFITSITGITNDMVVNAPKFYEIAKDIVEITEDCIFVAHNSRFDYGFIRQEFQNLGYTYSRKQLDTIKVFRRLFPGLKSYALGNLINHFDIKVESRHRAMSDVMATLDLLKLGLKIPDADEVLKSIFGIDIKESKLPQGLSYEDIENLPQTTGVYYFLDLFDNFVYIGKAKNIKKRVKQHFQKISPKTNKFFNTVRKIDFIETGSELIALLLEAEEIKKYKPPVNKALRKDNFPYKIFYFKDDLGYINFSISKKQLNGYTYLNGFSSRQQAKVYLESISYKYSLCKKLSGVEYHEGPCFEFGINKCMGACTGQEISDLYNERAYLAINDMNYHFDSDFFIIEKGRNDEESAIVLIENGNYAGFSFLNKNEYSINNFHGLKNHIKTKAYDKDFNQIIKRFVINGKVDIIQYEENKNI